MKLSKEANSRKQNDKPNKIMNIYEHLSTLRPIIVLIIKTMKPNMAYQTINLSMCGIDELRIWQ